MKTCLIVDDSEVIRTIVVRMIEELELKSEQADNAAAGVAYCQNQKPDVVLLDWDLPSMGALDFLRGAGELEQEMRPAIVLCATENDPQQFSLAKAAGAEYHILKPFDKPALQSVLQEIGVLGGEEDEERAAS